MIFYMTAKDAGVSTDAPMVAIRAYERGFYPIFTCASAETLNSGIPQDVVESAHAASMFGWRTPAARKAVDYINEQATQ